MHCWVKPSLWVQSLEFLEGSGGFVFGFLVEGPGFERVQSSVFPDLGLCSVEPISQPNRFKVQAFCRSSNRVEVRF